MLSPSQQSARSRRETSAGCWLPDPGIVISPFRAFWDRRSFWDSFGTVRLVPVRV